MNTNRTDGAKGADKAKGGKGRARGGAEKGQRGEGTARRRDGAEKGRKMRGELNWQHGEGYKRYAREEDALNVLRGGTSERFAPKIFTVSVRPKVKAFFAMPGLQGGAKEAKFVPLCTQKGRRRKNINRNHARGARIHLSYLYVFQGYMHFLQTLHSWGLKFDNQRC